MLRTLVLDQGYQPHRIIRWERAIAMVLGDKAEILEEYDEDITTVTLRFKVPSVIRILRAIPRRKKAVRFSRINIMTRDGFSCQYCGKKLTISQLTYDHVRPRSQKGPTSWENIVSACYPCNGKKRNRTPEEAGMKLLRQPYKPTTLPLVAFHFEIGRDLPSTWASYVYWQGELEQS